MIQSASATIFNSTMSLIIIILLLAVITTSLTLVIKHYFYKNPKINSNQLPVGQASWNSTSNVWYLEKADETEKNRRSSCSVYDQGRQGMSRQMGKRDRRSLESFCYIPVNSNLKNSNFSRSMPTDPLQVENSNFNPNYYNTILSTAGPIIGKSRSLPHPAIALLV